MHAADLRPADSRNWSTVWIGDPRYDGLDAWKRSPLGERLRVAVSTPILTWHSRNGTVLPGDQVVFELNNHVLLVDLETRRVAVVAIGRGPVVLLPPSHAAPTTIPATAPSISPP